MEKLCDRIDWNNNTSPALNETNLNRLSKAVDDIDNRVIAIAGTVMETVPQIQEDLAEAQELVEDAEAISTHPPIIGQNGNWWTWDTDLNQYVDSGVDAGVSVNVGTTTTLSAGSDATVTNSGTDTDPILNFGIPQGVAGQNGQDGADGQDGVSPEVTITTITGGHEVTITDADHPTGQSFNVMDGTNGQGVPASGTTGQVLTKASNADYDTTWTTPSGGSGGHTILNSSGTAMTQRGKLQFDGATVTDDSANDKTIVTTTPQSMIGDAWVVSHAYAVGDYCIDGNVLYKCKTAHTSSASNRPPYASYWDAVSVASQLGGGSNEATLLLDKTYTASLQSGYNNSSFGGNASETLADDYTNYELLEAYFYDESGRIRDSQIIRPANVIVSAATSSINLQYVLVNASTKAVSMKWAGYYFINSRKVAVYVSEESTASITEKSFRTKLYGIK